MDKITYKTKNAIFEFPKSDVFERLQYHENELNSLEADNVVYLLFFSIIRKIT